MAPGSWPPTRAAADWSLHEASTCDGYFGSGWDERAALVGDHTSPVKATREASLPNLRGGQAFAVRDGSEAPLECFFNDAHPSSYCILRRVALHPSRVRVSQGNETMSSVLGRKDEAELPVYQPGAFEVLVSPDTPEGSAIPPVHAPYVERVGNLPAVPALLFPRFMLHLHR